MPLYQPGSSGPGLPEGGEPDQVLALNDDLEAFWSDPPPGVPGPQGPAGPAGPAGADGQDGADGADGADGEDGADGAAGAQGAQGPQGPAGAAGAAGATGATGPAGIEVIHHGTNGATARGSAAVTYWLGTATPANALAYDLWLEENI